MVKSSKCHTGSLQFAIIADAAERERFRGHGSPLEAIEGRENARDEVPG